MRTKDNYKFMSKFIHKFLNKTSIKQQLYTIYFIAVFLPIAIIGTFLIVNTRNLLTNYHRDLLQ